MGKKKGRAAVMAVAMLGAAGLAAEPSGETAAELPAVIVEASRLALPAEELPQRVEVYDARAIAESGARSVAEFLGKTAMLDVRTLNANPINAQVSLRGYGENGFGRCQVQLDGEALNAVDMEPPNLLRLPLDQVERIEILRGPSTVLNGDGASAGVINVVTLVPAEDSTRFVVRVGSEGTAGASVRRTGADAESGVSYRARYGYLRSDGYREHSGYETHLAAAALRREYASGSEWTLKADYAWTRSELPGALSYSEYQRDRRQSTAGDDNSRQHEFALGSAGLLAVDDENCWRWDLTYAQKWREADWGSSGYRDEYRLSSVRLRPRFVNTATWWECEQQLTLGTDCNWEHYVAENGSEYLPPDPFFDRFRLAGYAHEEFFLSDEWSLVAGVRLEEIWNRWHRDDRLDAPASTALNWAYEAGVVYRLTAGHKLYLRQTRFYRSPFCDELNYVEAGTELEPESGYSLDGGWEGELGCGFKGFVDGYGSRTEDEIFYNPYHTPTAWGWAGYNCNAPATVGRLGADVGLKWEREGVAEASVRYGYVEARSWGGQYDGCRVPLVPQSQVRAEVKVHLGEEVILGGGYRWVGEQTLGGDFRNVAPELAAYSLFDVMLEYAPVRWGLEGLKVTFTIDNLFDCHYCDYAGYSDYAGCYYYPAAGRTFLVSVAYEF